MEWYGYFDIEYIIVTALATLMCFGPGNLPHTQAMAVCTCDSWFGLDLGYSSQ